MVLLWILPSGALVVGAVVVARLLRRLGRTADELGAVTPVDQAALASTRRASGALRRRLGEGLGAPTRAQPSRSSAQRPGAGWGAR